MKKKIISGLITLSFIFVFTYGFVNFVKPEITVKTFISENLVDKIRPVPNHIGPGNKSIKDITPDITKVLPEERVIPKVIEQEKRVSIIQVEYNEYIKTISGAAIAWAVKEICQFIFYH